MDTRTCILSPAGGFQSLLEDHHPHHQTSLTACLLQRTTPVHPSQLSLVLAELCWLLPLLSTPRHLLTPVQEVESVPPPPPPRQASAVSLEDRISTLTTTSTTTPTTSHTDKTTLGLDTNHIIIID